MSENPQQIKGTKGVKAYLRLIGSAQDVLYPQHWKKEECVGHPPSRTRLSPQSTLYQQIVKLVSDTFDRTNVGIGFDGAGLAHSKIIVRRIEACKNVALFRQYDTTRKNMCMDASVNQYAPVHGLKGEQEITTRVQITGNNLQRKIPTHTCFINRLLRIVDAMP